MADTRRTVPSLVVAGATAAQSLLLVVWSTRVTTFNLMGGVVGFAVVTALVALALMWRNVFEARLAAALIATYALSSGLIVVTIGLPTLQPDRTDPVALGSLVAAAVGYVALELDRRARVERAARRRAHRTYA